MMIVNLKTQQLSSLKLARSCMAGTAAVPFIPPAQRDRYRWVAKTLTRFGYSMQRRAERGLVPISVRWRGAQTRAVHFRNGH